jgi:hypothetical protein
MTKQHAPRCRRLLPAACCSLSLLCCSCAARCCRLCLRLPACRISPFVFPLARAAHAHARTLVPPGGEMSVWWREAQGQRCYGQHRAGHTDNNKQQPYMQRTKETLDEQTEDTREEHEVERGCSHERTYTNMKLIRRIQPLSSQRCIRVRRFRLSLRSDGHEEKLKIESMLMCG